jgi:hypothetical protein
MAITSQDFIKGITITAQTEVTGSEMEQLIDAAQPASDKGLIIETTDTADDTPVVPDPDTELEGITPEQWKRYRWKRVSFNADEPVKNYVWNPALTTSDATFLKWEWEGQDANDALVAAEQAATDAATAVANAATAVTTANTAQTAAENAQATADVAQATADLANSSAQDTQGDIADIDTAISALQAKTYYSNSNLATMLDGMGLKLLPRATFILKDVKASTVESGTFTTGAWQTRELNDSNATNPDLNGYCTLNGDNTFDLVPGIWLVEIDAPAYAVELHKCRLYNVTTAAPTHWGSSEKSPAAALVTTSSKLVGYITVTPTTKFRVEHRCSATKADNGFGIASGFADTEEVYTQVRLTYLGSL